ncbi:MAG: DNA polymerase/3'-5' exonuclease PolX [Candidatus Omnitrophota bacterium]
MLNRRIAGIFRNIAGLLEIKGENPFRVRAYLRAADSLEDVAEDLEDVEREGRLTVIPGIGRDLADKIREFICYDRIEYYERLRRDLPEGLLEVLSVPGLGPKTAKLLFDNLGVDGIVALEKCVRDGRLRSLPGIKKTTENNILRGIVLAKRGREQMHLGAAWGAGEEFARLLRAETAGEKSALVGDVRRMKEAMRKIDILVSSLNPRQIIDAFTSAEEVKVVLSRSGAQACLLNNDDMQVHLRVVAPEAWGAALIYDTGSPRHNAGLRNLVIEKGLRLNRYGLIRNEEVISWGEDEAGIYRILGLPYIPPELREGRGEIEAALNSNLPCLVEAGDIRGDLHIHSLYSDGRSTIEDIAGAAQEMGYEYVAVTDHSVSLKVARGLDEAALDKKRREILALNKKFKTKIFLGAEVELDGDGNCDYPARVLERLDIVIGAVHSRFRQGRDKMTQRLINACRNKHIDIIAHPTGRLWGARKECEIDLDSLFRAAADTQTILEINASPTRLDLNDVNARRAGELGVKFVISTDAHDCRRLNDMRFGLGVARRAWLGKEAIINTLSLRDISETIFINP